MPPAPSLAGARKELDGRFPPLIIDEIEQAAIQFFKERDHPPPFNKPEHSRYPRIVRLEKELVEEIKRCWLAHLFTESRMISDIESHREKMEDLVRWTPPRRKNGNNLLQLTCDVARVLRENNIPLKTYEDIRKNRKQRRGKFAAAVHAAVRANAIKLKKTKPYLLAYFRLLKEYPIHDRAAVSQRTGGARQLGRRRTIASVQPNR